MSKQASKWSRNNIIKRPMKETLKEDVPEHQLYRDIDRGYRHFLAERIKRETLRNAR